MPEIVYKEESYAIVGACFEAYNVMGCGFIESVYHECVKIELELRGIPFRFKQPLQISYKQRQLERWFEPDFVCFDKIILDLKAERELTRYDRAQMFNYLKFSGHHLAILANFGQPEKLQSERIVLCRSALIRPIRLIRGSLVFVLRFMCLRVGRLQTKV